MSYTLLFEEITVQRAVIVHIPSCDTSALKVSKIVMMPSWGMCLGNHELIPVRVSEPLGCQLVFQSFTSSTFHLNRVSAKAAITASGKNYDI